MKHIAKRRARARRPFPICITPFRKGVANRRNTTASLRRLYHTAQKSQALPIGRACCVLLAEFGEEHHEHGNGGHDGEDAEHPLPQNREGGFESSHILFLLTSRAAARG